MKALIGKLKANKKYNTLSDKIIKKELEYYFKRHPDLKNKKLNKNEEKIIIKGIRKKLHRIYSSYQTRKKKKREKLLEELRVIINNIPINKRALKQITYQLLSMTLSTKERLPYYEFVFKNIFNITGKPKTIIDLGSGLNPLSLPLINIKEINYYAYDIDTADINFLNRYFVLTKKINIKGKAEILDVTKIDNIKKIPTSDLVFMFKLIDLIDQKKSKISRELIKNLFEKNKTKFIVASFATKTLSRRTMNLPRRTGFEKMLEFLNLHFKSFSIENEIFYVIKK